MLRLKITSGEAYDEERGEFVDLDPEWLEFEHSLASLSKWEQKHEKPFLDKSEKTTEETLDYIRAMLLTPDVSEDKLKKLTQDHYNQINAYINAKQSATWFRENPNQSRSRETITSELIYYWMVALNIDWEAQHWHLSRLLTLIRICNEKNSPNKKKMSRADMAAQRRALNDQRRAQFGHGG